MCHVKGLSNSNSFQSSAVIWNVCHMLLGNVKCCMLSVNSDRKGCWWSDWNLGELDVNGKSVKKRIVLLWAGISHLVGSSVKVGLGGPCWWCSWCVLFYSWLTMAVSGDCIQLWSHLFTCMWQQSREEKWSEFSTVRVFRVHGWCSSVIRSIFRSETGGFLSLLQAGTGGHSHRLVVFLTHKSHKLGGLCHTLMIFFRLGVYRMVFLTDWWSLSYTDGLCHWLGDFLTDLWSFWQISSVCSHQFHRQWPALAVAPCIHFRGCSGGQINQRASISLDVQGVK